MFRVAKMSGAGLHLSRVAFMPETEKRSRDDSCHVEQRHGSDCRSEDRTFEIFMRQRNEFSVSRKATWTRRA